VARDALPADFAAGHVGRLAADVVFDAADERL
jgi:hypothetical protein